MKKFILGFISGIIFAGLLYGVFGVLIPGIKRAQEKERQTTEGIECQNINPNVRKYGSLKLKILYKGEPATNLETDISLEPDPDDYCSKDTDSDGMIVINKMPVGEYYVYFNASNYPEKYGIPSAQEKIKINANETLEMEMDLINYQR